MKYPIYLLGMLSILSIATPVVAGGWGSSGGESFRDGHNPWFIQNTPVVRYCVKLDGAGFSADPAKAHQLVQRAISYWQNEFKTAKEVMKPEFPVDIATQQFVAVDCAGHEDANVDLTFQLGYGTLDAKQRTFLVDPRKYVGIAVRTDYDEVNLRGKGFIYISSDRGDNRFNAETVGSVSAFVDQPWQYDGLLYRVLVHELGHVFGLPHVGGGVNNFSNAHNETQKTASLMSEQYPEEIVQRQTYRAFTALDELDPFFMPRTEFHDCSLTANAIRFFKLAPGQTCVHVKFVLQTTSVDVNLFSSAGLAGNRLPIGHSSWTDWDKESSKLNMQVVAVERITPKQQVFHFPVGEEPAMMVGAMIFGLDFPITFKDTDGEARNVYFRLAPQSYEAIGSVEGKVALLLNGK